MSFLLHLLLLFVQSIFAYAGMWLVLIVTGGALFHVAGMVARRFEAKTAHQDGGANPQPNFVLRARMKRLAKATLLLVPAKAPGFSKLGGQPELPDGMDWPAPDGRPAAFILQLDLSVFRRHGGFEWLPETGRIYLFFDDQMNGSAGAGRVIYTDAPPGSERAAPAGLDSRRRFSERRVAFLRSTSFPSQDWLESDWSDELDWATWPFAEGSDFGDEIEHRVGGYPAEIQGGQMAVECEHLWRGLTPDWRQPVAESLRRAARQWRLLLQIDSDPALGMNWGDAGRLYVFIRTRDAKRAHFSKTVTIWQTH